MKKAVLFHLIILLFACNQSNDHNAKSDNSKDSKIESKTGKESIDDDEIISDIRNKFENINQNSASYETKNMEIIGESAEGGELRSYYQNEALKKIVASYFGETGKLVEEYYFSENKAFFVFTQQYSYNKPISVEDSKVKKIDENRYYFHGSKLVRWVDPNKEKIDNSKFSQKETEIYQKINALKKKLGYSNISQFDGSVDMRSLFRLSPISIFDETTEGLNLSEKNDLLKNGESASWKIIDESKTKIAVQCKNPSSEVALYFFKNKDNLDGLLFAQVVNEKNNNIQSWKYTTEEKTLQKADVLKKYNANDFVSKEDKLPDTYNSILNHTFVDDQTIEVSLHTWMEKEFENRKIINKIFLKWNGETFEEKIEKIK